MKLYYDTENDMIVEAGEFADKFYTRTEHGTITTHNNLGHLVLIGDVYSNPLKLTGVYTLSKVNGNDTFGIIQGYAKNRQIEEGSRFIIHGQGFGFYSTNLVVATEIISDKTIDFYTLSGSHYRVERLND